MVFTDWISWNSSNVTWKTLEMVYLYTITRWSYVWFLSQRPARLSSGICFIKNDRILSFNGFQYTLYMKWYAVPIANQSWDEKEEKAFIFEVSVVDLTVRPWGDPCQGCGFNALRNSHFHKEALLWFSQFTSVAQSCPTLCDPMDCSTPGLPVHHQLPEFTQTHMSIESVMPSNHLILFRPLLLLPSVFPRIRVFSSEAVLPIRWPKYWSFSFSISPSNEQPGLISFRMDWLDLLAVQGTLKSLLQHHSSKASIV